MRALVLGLLLTACAAPAAPIAPVAVGGSCRVADGLPDRRCTPGDVDPRVTPGNVSRTICRRGYSASVRPPEEVTHRLKVRLTRAYGLAAVPFSRMELDHLVPLSLGGASTEANLWPELREGSRGAAAKDDVELRLHDAVCEGRVGLRAAQRAMATDWRRAP